jgi:hypothetical protein
MNDEVFEFWPSSDEFPTNFDEVTNPEIKQFAMNNSEFCFCD